MKAFEPLSPDDPKLQKYNKLLKTPLGATLGTNSKLPSPDSYLMAVNLARICHKINNEDKSTGEDSAKLLLELIQDLEKELKLINKNPEELALQIESSREIPSEKPKPTLERKEDHEVLMKSMGLQGNFQSRDIQVFQSFLNFTYSGLDQLEGYFSLGASQESNLGSGEVPISPDIEVKEAQVKWKGAKKIDEVRLGRYKKDLGHGLVAGSPVAGVEVAGNYQDYQLELGYFDGIYAAIESPFFLDTPVRLYTFQKHPAKDGLSQRIHTGFHIQKRINRFSFSTEFAEFQGESRPDREHSDRNALSLKVDYDMKEKGVKLLSSLTHTGENYEAVNSQRGFEEKNWYQDLNPSLQEEVMRSLSNYFGSRLYSLPGYSDLKLQLSYQASPKDKIELHFDYLYDHTRMNQNADNGFSLSTLNYERTLTEDYAMYLSFQNLAWEQNGIGNRGFMAGRNRENFNLIQSAFQVNF